MKTTIKRAANRVIRPVKILCNSPLTRFEFNFHSQNGEDGVLEEIMHRLNLHSGTIIDIGAWNGIYLSNVYHALQKNKEMQALFVDADQDRVNEIAKLPDADRIMSICGFVTPSGDTSLVNLIGVHQYSLLADVEILNIDIDGMDYRIWESLPEYCKPQVVIIEIGSSLPITSNQIGDQNQTTAFVPMLELGHRKGYTCVHHHGNMIFVRNDVVDKVGRPDDEMGLFKFKA